MAADKWVVAPIRSPRIEKRSWKADEFELSSRHGLKNYLFFGRAEVGATSALFYSLVGNCKVQGVDPERYLEMVLNRKTLTTTAKEAAQLTHAKLAEEIRATQPVPAIVETERIRSAA